MEGSWTALIAVGSGNKWLALALSIMVGVRAGCTLSTARRLSDWWCWWWWTGWGWKVDDSDDAVRSRQDSSLDVDRFAGVRSLIDWLGVVDGEGTVASFGRLQTPWWLAGRSPVETPIDVRFWDGDRLAGKGERGSLRNLQVGLWGLDDSWLDTSDLIRSIVTIVSTVAMEGAWDALVATVALEFSGFAGFSMFLLAAVQLIRIVSAIVVTVAKPHLLDASLVVTFELVRLADTEGWAVSLVGSVATVWFSVTDVVVLDAFVVSASFLVGLALPSRRLLGSLELLWAV